MPRFKVTVVLTTDTVFEDIEIEAPTPEQAEEQALAIDTTALKPAFSQVVDTHVEADLL